MKIFELLPLIDARKRDCHKGDFGRVMIVGGSPGLTGAVYLAGMAAAHCGSGLVTVALPQALESVMETKTSEVMTRGLVCTREGLLSEFAVDGILLGLDHFDALAFGPGAGTGASTGKLLKRVLSTVQVPMVIDADGLNLLAKDLSALSGRPAYKTILTPHLGEMARLCGTSIQAIQKNPETIAAAFAKKYKVILLLKGPTTLVTDGDCLYRNTSGNPGLACAGSGDVLTGVAVSLLGQGCEIFQAAAGAAYLHGITGDMAFLAKQSSFLSSDLLKYIPKAVEESRDRLR